ncbi:FAD-dependent oxidoreductase [Paraburkholderia saeva]|uniref:FAD-dependent oxidoreductase n=1 Tax=Paraburkholderia saeva TaxID=2777537 RepID=UPI001D569442|nr:FAD-dependent oxidoreductase [Paraburkholderia saeva]CAG4886548.1 Nitric oxide reductase FlRd-NAD(+) reductase [Paraburkholderia saeva]
MKKWLCVICGLIYDEAQGWPKDGIAAGTHWEDVPEDWKCPDCGVGKADFEMIEITEPVAPIVQLASPTQTQALAASSASAPAAAGTRREGPLVIVGSGHAGYSLAQAVRLRDPEADIVVLTRESGHLYSKPALSIATSQDRSPDALIAESPFEIEQRLKIRVYPHCDVQAIDAGAHQLRTSHGVMRYSQLVLATGASPVRLDVAGRADALLGVNNLDDYRVLRHHLEGASRVAIIGDGLIGCEFANDLAASGFDVNVIGIGKWPLERLLPQQAGTHLQRALAALGVKWQLQNSVSEILGEPGDWTLVLANGSRISADVVISAVGLAPNVALAADCGLEVGRGIRTDAQLRTNVADIFALGDCVEIDGRPAPYLAPINYGVEALARTLTCQPTDVLYPPMPVQVKTPAAPLILLPVPAALAPGEWCINETGDGFSCGHFDSSGQMNGFALIGHQAQALRGRWVEQCKQRSINQIF